MRKVLLSASLIGLLGYPWASYANGPRALPQLSMADACKAVDAALAAQPSVSENVAVVDADGSLICFKHQDGAIHAGVPGSIGKAVASAFFGVSSAQLEVKMGAASWVSSPRTLTSAAPLPVPTLPGVAAASLPAPIYSQGARPIIRSGVVDGAVGCGGGTAEQDENCATAGAAALPQSNQNS
jgi:glc operon protein GlcG